MTDWAIPQQAKLKYTQLFNLHDRSRSGFLSGLQCRDILLQSGLPRNILAEIWNLSDIDGDGQLTREEFILAMHLTSNVRSGQSLPTELPADLVPPSYRRTRSISATSVNSATSASSSINSGNINDDHLSQKSTENATVLNTNSFEDKRRENFEKGRAELEKRRLKILEQQSGILKEQLMASKKLVAEAKSKIDVLRAERDTKMGTITFLEAQLKTLQDKKAYLNQEELSLIAIAKDLNLVSAAQAELDQVATEAKKQSITQMKEKLKEFIQEKEEKAKELSVVSERLEDSKKQLKSLSEEVGKTYQTYKEKVADAKVKREQFIVESKSQAINLDSVWDAEPNFTTTNQINNNNSRIDSKEDPWTTANNDPISTNFNAFADPIGDSFGFTKSSNQFDSSTKKKYKALYAFEARNPDELTINPGDIVVGTEGVCEPGWLSGECNGRTGLFPEAYVELLPESSVSQSHDVTPTIKSNEIPPFGDLSSLPQQQQQHSDFSESMQSNSSTTSTAVKYKVIYAFDARNPDELTINPGDIIIGLENVTEPGWLSGELNGQKGLFPEAYVEKIVESVQDPLEPGGQLQRMSSVGSLRSKKSRSKKAEVATVIANYRALGQEQLNLEKGQLVCIRRKMDSGWWEGEIQIKGKKKQFGWFPASYVKLLSTSDAPAQSQ